MRARRLAVVFAPFMLLASAGALYACATTPGGPLGLIDRDDAEPPAESGADTSTPDTSTPDTSSPFDAADGSAPATDADTGAPDADAG